MLLAELHTLPLTRGISWIGLQLLYLSVLTVIVSLPIRAAFAP